MIRKSPGRDKAVPGPAARPQRGSKPAKVGVIPGSPAYLPETPAVFGSFPPLTSYPDLLLGSYRDLPAWSRER